MCALSTLVICDLVSGEFLWPGRYGFQPLGSMCKSFSSLVDVIQFMRVYFSMLLLLRPLILISSSNQCHTSKLQVIITKLI